MLRRISLSLAARRLGIPLADVAEIFTTLPADEPPSHRDWVRVSRVWKRQLEDRRRYIMNLERQLTACIRAAAVVGTPSMCSATGALAPR
jgi:MerR family redox-sensitive transcriptional activator SoxR